MSQDVLDDWIASLLSTRSNTEILAEAHRILVESSELVPVASRALAAAERLVLAVARSPVEYDRLLAVARSLIGLWRWPGFLWSLTKQQELIC